MGVNQLSIETFNNPATWDVYKFLHDDQENCSHRFEASNGNIILKDIRFDRNNDQKVDLDDYDLYVKDISGNDCRTHFSRKHTFATYKRAYTFITRAVIERDVLPQLKQARFVAISDTLDWDYDRQLLALSAAVFKLTGPLNGLHELKGFFTIFAELAKKGIFEGLDSLDPQKSPALEKLIRLFHNKKICPSDHQTATLPGLIDSEDDMDKLLQLLALLDGGYESVKFLSSSHDFLKKAMNHQPAYTAVAFRGEVAAHLVELMIAKNKRAGTDIVYDYVSDPTIPFSTRDAFITRLIQRFFQAGTMKEYKLIAALLSGGMSIRRSPEGIRLRSKIIDGLLNTVQTDNQNVSKRLVAIDTLFGLVDKEIIDEKAEGWDVNQMPYGISSQEYRKIVDGLMGLTNKQSTPLLVRAAVFAGVLSRTQGEGKEDSHLNSVLQVVETRINALGITLAKDGPTDYHTVKAFSFKICERLALARIKAEGFNDLYQLLNKDYGFRLEMYFEGEPFTLFESRLNYLLTVLRIIQRHPDIITELKKSRSKTVFIQLFKYAWNVDYTFHASILYEFYGFLKLPLADQERILTFYQQSTTAFGKIGSFSGTDFFRYLNELSKMDANTRSILFAELSSFIKKAFHGHTPQSLYYFAHLAKRPQTQRDSIINRDLPWYRKRKIIDAPFRPHSILTMIAISDLLQQKGKNLDETLWERAKKYTGTDHIDLNDLYFYLATEDSRLPRQRLLALLNGEKFPDVHRMDDNFEYYKDQYGKFENFSTIDLFKMYLFNKFVLKIPKNRQELGRALDYKKEIGYSIALEKNSAEVVTYVWSNPFSDIVYEGQYQPPMEHTLADATSMALLHSHPEPGYEGPSAGVSYAGGGDVNTERDGFVVSVMSGRKYAVHFYDSVGYVVCLGIYAAD